MSPDRIHTQFNIEVPKTKGSNTNGNLEVLNMKSGEKRPEFTIAHF